MRAEHALTLQQKLGLKHARHLAEHGVPVFLARPALKDGVWDPTGGSGSSGYKFPTGWQQTVADPTVVDRWQPGWALGAVMGHTVDLLDVDPRKGGDDSRDDLADVLPRSYGRQTTPSGGTHDFIAPLGVRSLDGVRPGIDIKSGLPDGEGCGFAFLAPTVKLSKSTGEIGTYEWTTPPDLTELVLIGSDTSGLALAELITATRVPAVVTAEYDGAAYADLSSEDRERADAYVAAVVAKRREKLAKIVTWPEGATDEFGRGWEAQSRDLAWFCAKLEATPWTGVDDGEALYEQLLPLELAEDPKCADKWTRNLVSKAALDGVGAPPWLDQSTPEEDFTAVGRPVLQVKSTADCMDWLMETAGTGQLAGLFRRGFAMVHTPRIGEAGYIAPEDSDDDGPAQVRRVEATELAARVDTSYRVVKARKSEDGRKFMSRELFPLDPARRVLSVVDRLPNLRDLVSVTHTPVIRPDGSVLDEPGYDESTRLLYLPDIALDVRTVPAAPTGAQVAAAIGLLHEMIAQFPFVSEHDEANYLGALITPLLRPIIPPPYQMVAIGAPQPGSGKSLLAALMRIVHGGVFKSEFPTNSEELRKVITSTLDATSAPVVQFDNVMGVLKSSVLDGLLTSAEWSDRLLGGNNVVNLRNDRLWVVTGNNLKIGGDLGRRTLWITINAGVPNPERRTGFKIPNLEGWARERRGELLWALLVLVRSWVVDGRPVEDEATSDSFGPWVAAVRGILAAGGVTGTFGHLDTVQEDSDPEEEDWGRFYIALLRQYGSESWSVREVLDGVTDFDGGGISADDMPEPIGGHRAWTALGLGKQLGFRAGRWVGKLCVVKAETDRSGARWVIREA